MKRICLALLVFTPLISSAQEHLLGKSKEEVRAAQNAANCPFERTAITELLVYDRFCCDNTFERLCYYWHDTCYKVTEVRNIGLIDTLRERLNASAKKIKKDQWTNKNATVKINLIKYKRQNEVVLDYVAINRYKAKKRYVIGL